MIIEDQEKTHDHFAGLTVWDEKIQGKDIPGTTRVPIQELSAYFDGKFSGLVGLDLGSGSGRSTKELTEKLPGSRVHAIDLSLDGLRNTKATPDRYQASALDIPFAGETFDFISVCGVFTNLVFR